MATAPDGFECPALPTSTLQDGKPVHVHDCPSCTATGGRRFCEDCEETGTVTGTDDDCPFFADCEFVAAAIEEHAAEERRAEAAQRNAERVAEGGAS